MCVVPCIFFFFNDTATTEIYTLSLHDALPICGELRLRRRGRGARPIELLLAHDVLNGQRLDPRQVGIRSEEHTSELQSQFHLVCRLLLEKKKYTMKIQLYK